MKHTLTFLFVLILSACTLGQASPTPLQPTAIPVHLPTSTPLPRNLALGKLADASSLTSREVPGNAVDGNLETLWNAGTYAPQWLQIDLQSATIESIRLIIAQYPNGETTHQVFAGASPSDLAMVHEFSGYTTDNQTLEFKFNQALTGIRYIKILTTKSPSWVAWKEIEVFGYEGGELPTPKPQLEVADVIYYHGQILTMEKDQPTAEAIAIQGDKILALGKQAEVMTLKGASTKMVDLNGLTLTPGFIDSHAHRIGDRVWYGENTSVEDVFQKTLQEGWTSIYELFVTDQRLAELENLDRANALPVRVSMYLTMNYDYEYVTWWQAYQPLQQYSPYLQIVGLKITLDREWGEQIFFDQQQLDQMVLDATQVGWQVATHSFSPKANEEILNAYEKALQGKSNNPLRLRIEHTGTVTDEELQKMAELGIIGSVQLIGSTTWPDDISFQKYIPKELWPKTARFRDMLNAGVFLIANTDDPWCCTDWRHGNKVVIEPASVMNNIYQGITRIDPYRKRQPEPGQVSQKLTVEEVLEMMTIRSAYAGNQEDVIGSLKAGKYADIVILSANPLTTPVDQLLDIAVVMTMVGGDVKYCALEYAAICGS